jgi:23S rRNA (guanosine2251-2'-O)-methyltransferase
LSTPSRVAMGYHACKEALAVNGKHALALVISDSRKPGPELKNLESLAKKHSVSVRTAKKSYMDSLGHGHQGFAVEMGGWLDFSLDSLKDKESALVVACDGIVDPQNLGSIFRTSWLMGVSGILLSKHQSAGLTPVVHSVASGGVEHVPVRRTSKFNDDFSELKEMGFWIYGLDGGGSAPLWKVQFPAKTVIVVGSEASGMRKPTRNQCDDIVGIPQVDAEASYNAGVAFAIGLSEAKRQIENSL